MECSTCGNVADSYVEYDGANVLIDLILQSRQAYRYTYRMLCPNLVWLDEDA